MSERREQHSEDPEDDVSVDKPFVDEISDWIDSPEGELWTEVCDALEDLLKGVWLDAKRRQFIWSDAERLDLDQSVQRIHKQYPDFPVTRSKSF